MNLAESLINIFPELILLVFSLAILIAGLFSRKNIFWGILGMAGIILAGLYLPKTFYCSQPIFSGLLVNDSFSRFFRGLALLVGALTILVSMGYKEISEKDRPEYYFLLLVAVVGMMFAVSSTNLMMIYLALETISLISYILVGFLKRDTLSGEAALKYFLFGTLATGIMLYGISFFYGIFGTVDLSAVGPLLGAGVNNPVFCAALLLIFAGIAFKCSLVPFHMWTPDVYQGAPTPITAFISVGPKAVGFVILLRVFSGDLLSLFLGWKVFFAIFSIATMTVGNIAALSQVNIKRMLAYSSIAQAGYILIGFIAGTALGIKALLFYILAYAFMNMGAFACVTLISRAIKSDLIDDYAGLGKRAPLAAFMLSMFLLSLAGIPPLAGFLGKFLLFASAIEAKLIWLAVAAAVNSVIAFYYYVYVIKCMYLDEPKVLDVQPKSIAIQAALIIALIGILIVGIFPQPFLMLFNHFN